MTAAQEARWTTGTFTDDDRAEAKVWLPHAGGGRFLSMADALANDHLKARIVGPAEPYKEPDAAPKWTPPEKPSGLDA